MTDRDDLIRRAIQGRRAKVSSASSGGRDQSSFDEDESCDGGQVATHISSEPESTFDENGVIDFEGMKLDRAGRLRVVMRMALRNFPDYRIAESLGVSVKTIQRDRKAIKEQLSKEAGKVDTNTYLGESLAFYREVTGTALTIATASSNPLAARLSGLKVAMMSKSDESSLLHTIGVFDANPYRPEKTDKPQDIGDVMAILGSIVDASMSTSSDAEFVESMKESMASFSGSDDIQDGFL